MEGVIFVEPARITQLKELIQQVGPEHAEAVEAMVIGVYDDCLKMARDDWYDMTKLASTIEVLRDRVKEYKSWVNVPNWSEVDALMNANQ
jgi:hypothetical protein